MLEPVGALLFAWIECESWSNVKAVPETTWVRHTTAKQRTSTSGCSSRHATDSGSAATFP